MSYYCSDSKRECYFGLEKTNKQNDKGPYLTQKKCIEASNTCQPYKCTGTGDNKTCSPDDSGMYHSKTACDAMCVSDDKNFCKKLQDYLFSYLDFDLNCTDKSQQNLNIVLLIAIIWIGILLF